MAEWQEAKIFFEKVEYEMAKKLTEKTLIIKLNIMNQEELVKIISDLFKTNKSVEARLNLMILDGEWTLT